jgi:hypothetical protein
VLGERKISDLIESLRPFFKFRVTDPDDFVGRTYVVPIQASNDIAVDITIGYLGYEQIAVERSITVEHSGVRFKVCTAEDLVVHKAISEREKDWADIEGVLIRQGLHLDQEYILHWLRQFAEALDRPELLTRYRGLQRKSE